jgi:hypothetical protein
LDWRRDPAQEAAGEQWGAARGDPAGRQLVSGGARPTGVVRVAVGGARGLCKRRWLRPAGKNRVAASGSGARGRDGSGD